MRSSCDSFAIFHGRHDAPHQSVSWFSPRFPRDCDAAQSCGRRVSWATKQVFVNFGEHFAVLLCRLESGLLQAWLICDLPRSPLRPLGVPIFDRTECVLRAFPAGFFRTFWFLGQFHWFLGFLIGATFYLYRCPPDLAMLLAVMASDGFSRQHTDEVWSSFPACVQISASIVAHL